MIEKCVDCFIQNLQRLCILSVELSKRIERQQEQINELNRKLIEIDDRTISLYISGLKSKK